MDNDGAARYRRPAGVVAAVAISMSALFAGSAVSAADPYDGDDGGDSSYSGVDVGGGMQEAPSGGDAEPSGGGTNDEPGGTEPPGSGTNDEPGSGGPATGGDPAEPAESQAPQEDTTTAMASEVVTTTSTEVSSQEIASYQESVSSIAGMSSLTTGLSLSSPVALWNSSWISYDTFYRPVFTNPYRTPLSVLYDYGGQTQVFTVGPLERAALNVPNAGVYNFTAMTRPESGPATNLSVGSFSGGGYQPAPGQAPPQRPASLNAQRNVLVQVKFDRGTSAPFRVKTLTDLGSDPTVNGATKVLLDGEVPAWGEWSKTDKGEALFVITRSQTLPGVNPPAQEPLPGYNVQLTAAEKSSWIDSNKTVLISIAVGAGVLALAAVGFILLTKRRRTTGAES